MKLFVDMDGVLADFDNGIYSLCGKYPNQLTKKEVWATIHNHCYNNGIMFFKNLDLMPDALFLWKNIEVYNPFILTATGHSIPTAAQEKTYWAREHFPENEVLFVQDGANKHKFVKNDPEYKEILIDDRAKAIDPWIKAGGIGILHTSARQTLKELAEIVK